MTRNNDFKKCKVCGVEFSRAGIAGHMAGHARRGEYVSPYKEKVAKHNLPVKTTVSTHDGIPDIIVNAILEKVNRKDSTLVFTGSEIYIFQNE